MKYIHQEKLPQGVELMDCIKTGGNSTIYSAIWDDEEYIVKSYNQKNKDIDKRFEREVNAYKLLNENEIECIPEIRLIDNENKLIIMSKIKGANPKKNELVRTDFQRILKIYNSLEKEKLMMNNNIKIVDAPGNILDIDLAINELLKQLKKEIQTSKKYNLKSLKKINKFAQNFLELNRSELREIRMLNRRDIIFSFSDVGSHNTIKTKSGEIFFIDFEHSGWDDQVKQICDWLIRPNSISEMEGINLIKEYLYTKPSARRLLKLQLWLPLCCIKWLLIGISYNRKIDKENIATIEKQLELYKNSQSLALKYKAILIDK